MSTPLHVAVIAPVKIHQARVWATYMVLFALLLACLALPRYINADAATYLEVGNKLLDGERPYIGYEESNLPMIHLLSALPALIGRLTGTPSTLWLQLGMWGILCLSVLASDALIKASNPTNKAMRWLPLLIAIGGAMVFLETSWAQREQIFMSLYLPWLILRAQRYQTQTVHHSTGLLILIGICAGIGLMIKPYFVLTGLSVEIGMVVLARNVHIKTPEVLGILSIPALHALYFALNPDVLQALLTLLGRLQAGYQYGSVGLGFFMGRPDVQWGGVIAVSGVIIALRWGKFLRVIAPSLLLGFSIAILTGIAGYIAQGKGWNYHGLPYRMPMMLLSALALVELFHHYRQPRIRQLIAALFTIIAFAGLSIGLNITRGAMVADFSLPYIFRLADVVERYSVVGDRLLFVSPVVDPQYPLLPVLNRRSASRYAIAQPLAVSYYRYEGLPYTEAAHVVPEYAQIYLTHLAEDITRYAPPLIFLRSGPCTAACDTGITDYQDYLSARGFVNSVIMPEYDFLEARNGFHIYVRKSLAVRP